MLAAVVSDTHNQTQAVIQALQRYRLDALFFLGDYYADGEKMQQALAPKPPLFAVAGNGDAFLAVRKPTEQQVHFGGKNFFLAHGHTYHVKKRLDPILEKGQAMQANVVLFGHTHIPFLGQTPQGMWILNPGSASIPRGLDDATFGLIEWEATKPITLMILEVGSGQLLYSSMDLSKET